MREESKKYFYLALGKNIAYYRKLSKLNQESLGSLVGLSRVSVVNIERGRQQPSIFLLCKIANHLNVTLVQLVPAIYIPKEVKPDWKRTIDKKLGKNDADKETFNRFLFDIKNPTYFPDDKTKNRRNRKSSK